ncbi:MAG: outer membrane protein assembly factor [Fusobacterium sp.]|uniref:BamA/OMP85 family outer membrane protein n=1 Tax=Fusobacterium sp. TaxID=68766 RepID=UPI0026DC36C6|nr:outer membrane protein assembly factor [Fusobacterium sp.]MDO4690831.1 outer membrane protein assembly factor [Fusobacterium sp.]
MKKIVVFLIFALNTVIFAAVANLPIKSIEVINNENVPTELIVSTMNLKKGNIFSTEIALDDFSKIKATGYFEDVVIQPITEDGKIKVLVSVLEKPEVRSLLAAKGITPMQIADDTDKSTIVSAINIIGNKNFSITEIMELVNIKQGSYFSNKRVEEAQRRLLTSGYFSEVKPNVSKHAGKATITFSLVENPRVKNIVIRGNSVLTNAEISALLSTKIGETQNYNLLSQDREKILNAYQAKGYTLVNVADMYLDENGTLTIQIIEGIVRRIEVKKMVTKQKGNRRQPTDDVLKTQSYVIDREIEIIPGQVFDNNAYEATVQNLMRLGIFKNVKYEARSIPGDPQGIDLILLIDEDRTAILQGAISYGSEVGLMGSLSLKDSNWKGKAQEFGFTFEKSNKDYTGFTLEFFDPWIKDTDRVSWGWSAYKTSYGDNDSNLFHDIQTLGLSANIGKGLSRNVRLSIGGKVEKIDEKHRAGSYIKAPNGKWYHKASGKKVDGVDDKYYTWSIFPYITYDTRNNYLNPTSGEFVKFQVEAGYASGYKADYFGNATLELRKYHRGLFKNNTFAYRVIGGIMTDTTKESQTFWVGGGNSLRGYDGGFFKGTQKLVATIENRTQFNEVLGIVLFADAGRSWKQNGRDPDYLRDNGKFGRNIGTTAGVGLRLNTPIGPLRFDFGWPVGNKMDKDGMKFYFNMGHAF